MRPLRTATRRALGAVAAVGALGTAFTAGVVAGAGSAPAPARPGGVLDEAADQIATAALRPVDRAALEAAALGGMLDAAGDPWGSWTGDGAGSVGLWLRRAEDGSVVVDRVTAASPAADAGVRPGDRVQAVDGAGVEELTPARVAALLRGPKGTVVRVTTSRSAALQTLPLRREVHHDGPSVRTVGTTKDGVGRVVVGPFALGTGRQVREALAGLRAARVRGVLLDLRGNPGGRLDEAVETASAFLDGGPVVSYARRGTGPRRLDAEGDGDTTTPLVVLVDGGTASAAEVVAGALQDRGRAVLVGAQTFGKGSVQEPRQLGGGAALELTVARWTTPSGRSPDGVGLVPDVEVAPGAAADAVERRGADVLTGLVAGAGGRG